MNFMTDNNIDPIDSDPFEPASTPVQVESTPKPAAPTAPESVEAPSFTVQVILSAILHNPIRRNESTSVIELQRRLRELGFDSVIGDKPGMYQDGTQIAVQQFQSKNRLEVTDVLNADTLKAIFKGDNTVKVVV
jgi:peptidoglycan hydrolase-like protein with peptidoglycan-binding domain